MSKDKTTTQQNSLDDFTWDATGSADFFNIPGSGVVEEKSTSMEDVIKQVNEDEDDDNEVTKIEDKTITKSKPKEKEKEKTKKKTVTEDEEDEEEDDSKHTFFGQEGEEDVEDEDEEEDDEEDEEEKPKEKKEKVKQDASKDKEKKKPEAEQTDGQFYKTLASELKEKGVFENVEIDEDKEELTEEEFFDLQNEEVEARVAETFEAFAEEMDEDGKAFIKFKKNGGRTTDFVDVFVNSPLPDFGGKEFDPKNETHRKVVLETYLTLVENLDDEELEDRMTWLKEQGKDQAMSEKYYNKLSDIDTKQKAALLKDAEDKAKAREEGVKKFNKTLSDALNKVDTVGKFKITKEDKKKLGDSITKPTVKVGKNKYIPSFHSKLSSILKADTPETVNKLILLAKLVEGDFDIKDLVTTVETKVTQKVKSKIRDAKNGVKPSSSGQYSNNKRSLSDLFE